MAILLDGAMGTQLSARGFPLEAPLFSARALIEAPESVGQIHLDYILAGAQVLRTNSFGLHVETLRLAGIAARQVELATLSVALLERARQLAAALDPQLARFRIAASVPPRPPSTLPSEAVRSEYRVLADALVHAGADLILLETFTSLDEARLALEGLSEVGVPVWLAIAAGSPSADGHGPDGSRSTSGDPLSAILNALQRAPEAGEVPRRRPDALLINCTQIDAVPAALTHLAASVPEPGPSLGVYPHLGKRRHDGVWIEQIVDAPVFAEQMHAWVQRWPRLQVVGACCGSDPAFIAALRQVFQPSDGARERAYTHLAQLVP